jgi:hypothetical protein
MPVFAASNNKILKMVFAGAGVLILTALMIIWFNRGPQTAPSEPNPAPQAARTTPDSAQQTQPSATDQEELKRVLDMGVRGDVAGLLSVLKTGGFVSQMTAAHYLGQLATKPPSLPFVKPRLAGIPTTRCKIPFLWPLTKSKIVLLLRRPGSQSLRKFPNLLSSPKKSLNLLCRIKSRCWRVASWIIPARPFPAY